MLRVCSIFSGLLTSVLKYSLSVAANQLCNCCIKGISAKCPLFKFFFPILQSTQLRPHIHVSLNVICEKKGTQAHLNNVTNVTSTIHNTVYKLWSKLRSIKKMHLINSTSQDQIFCSFTSTDITFTKRAKKMLFQRDQASVASHRLE